MPTPGRRPPLLRLLASLRSRLSLDLHEAAPTRPLHEVAWWDRDPVPAEAATVQLPLPPRSRTLSPAQPQTEPAQR